LHKTFILCTANAVSVRGGHGSGVLSRIREDSVFFSDRSRSKNMWKAGPESLIGSGVTDWLSHTDPDSESLIGW